MTPFDLPSRLGSHATFAAVVDGLPTAILIGDHLGIHYANRSAVSMFGIDPRATGIVPFTDLHAHLRPRCPDTEAPVAPDEHPFTQALRGCAATRELLVDLPDNDGCSAVHCSSVPLWHDRTPIGAIVTHTDVSQLRETSETLRRTNREL